MRGGRRSRLDRLSGAAVAAGLVALSFVIYAPALSAEFVSDDRLAITGNAHVTGPLDPIRIFRDFSWWGAARSDAPGYRPLVTSSFAIDHAIANGDPTWFHAVNVALHGIVSWLVFALALRVGCDKRAALIAGIAFCVLPVHSEAVIWPVGRAELMAAAGFTGALCLLLDYRRSGRTVQLAAATVLFLAGLFSKENAVTLLVAPALAALLLPSSPTAKRRDAIATAAMAAATCVYVAVRAAAGDVIGGAAGDRLDNPLSALSFGARLVGAAAVLGRYLLLTVWPHPLSVDYSYDALGIDAGFAGDGYAIFGVGACIALAVCAWRSAAREPVIAYGLGLAAAAYSIVSNVVLVIGTAMAERLFYLPTVGLCLAAAPLLARLAKTAGGRGAYALAAVALAYGAVDFARARQWRTPVALFEAAVAAHPRSARAQMELATAYGQAGRTADAVASFERATAVLPAYAAAWYNLGNLHARAGDADAARRAYEIALRHAPRLVPARFNLGLLLMSSGRVAEAAEVLAAGVELAPKDAGIAMALGDAYLALGRAEQAVEAYGRVLALEPRASAALVNRGVALQRARGCDAAIPDYVAALAQQPADPTALSNAVACLRSTGRTAEADRLIASAAVANRPVGR